MCGIIGYIGEKQVLPILIDGLRRLEYRGYDSAGVAVLRAGEIELRRSAGKLARLEEAIAAQPLEGEYGIGHTRWATHGRPTEENAHPHVDCTGPDRRGPQRDHRELSRPEAAAPAGGAPVRHRDRHRDRGAPGRAGDEGRRARERGARALLYMRGLFALVLISADDPNKIVTVRNGPPIVVGLGDREFFVASDIPAILSHTRDVVFLGDEEMAVITPSGVEFTDYSGRAVSAKSTRVSWDPVMAEKAGYKHFMLKEIFEQPWAVRETCSAAPRSRPATVFLNEIDLPDEALVDVERVVILACGTSWHAGLTASSSSRSWRGCRSRWTTAPSIATAIRSSPQHAGGGDHAVGRDGRHAGGAARGAQEGGAQHRHLQRRRQHGHARDRRHGLHARGPGDRRGVDQGVHHADRGAAPAGALPRADSRDVLRRTRTRPHLEALTQLPLLIEQALKCEPLTEEIAKRFYQRSDFLYLGRGINYPIALEGALKLKEISYIHAEGYPAGEMKHGPIALIDEQMPVVAIAPNDHVFEKMIGNIQEVKARGGSVIALTTEGNEALLKELLDPDADFLITVPDAHPLLMPVLMVAAAPAAGVPHRRAARLRRRSAAEPGQERHGRIAGRPARQMDQAAERRGLIGTHAAMASPILAVPIDPHEASRDPGSGACPRARPTAASTPRASVSSRSACRSSMRRRRDGPNRVGHVPARDVRRRAVHRLEQAGAVSEAGRRQQAERADDGAGLVRQDVPEQVLGEDDVEGRRAPARSSWRTRPRTCGPGSRPGSPRRPRSRPSRQSVTFRARSPCPRT
jgi:glutamine---fructose-6-phosphate transaminase (isomerizing)